MSMDGLSVQDDRPEMAGNECVSLSSDLMPLTWTLTNNEFLAQ